MKNKKWPYWPEYGEDEHQAVDRVIKSNQLFADKEVKLFEEQFANFIGTKFAIGVGNATQGLHLSLIALKIGIGDEVIVTSYSWISTASCILMQNAVPVFCDIELISLGACSTDIEKKITENTKAIIITHMFGYPARINNILEVGKKFNIPVIEDSSHAFGASVSNNKLGSFGEISVFSLHQRKSLPVGDGGIVCTSNETIRDKIYRLRSFGDKELSYNYRMTEFAGALGQVGLRKIDNDNKIRNDHFKLFKKNLKNIDCLYILSPQKKEYSVFYATLLILKKNIDNLENKLKKLNELGIPIRKTWAPLNQHSHFNPTSSISRGIPWKLNEYNGSMKNVNYKSIDLPNVKKYCPSKVLELYLHPNVDKSLVKFSAKQIGDILI